MSSMDSQRLWQSLPRHRQQAKARVERAVTLAMRDHGVSVQELILACHRYYDSPAGRGQYARWPHTFIDDRGWEEDPVVWEQAPADGAPSNHETPEAKAARLLGLEAAE